MTRKQPENPTNEGPIEGLTFEQAYSELSEIVRALETSEHSLDEAMELYERGQTLIRYCIGLLDKAELKIKQLSGGEITEFPTVDEPT